MNSSNCKITNTLIRHLGLSQLVIVNLLHTSDVIERAKMLKRWIEIAELLQSGKCSNLFSFMAIMKGLESTQVCVLLMPSVALL